MSIAKRAISEAKSIEEANQIVRGSWLNAIEEHHLKYSGNCEINDILDIGCSVGVSTRYLAEKFPSAQAVVSAHICLSSIRIVWKDALITSQAKHVHRKNKIE
jgi:hypothetical protein